MEFVLDAASVFGHFDVVEQFDDGGGFGGDVAEFGQLAGFVALQHELLVEP